MKLNVLRLLCLVVTLPASCGAQTSDSSSTFEPLTEHELFGNVAPASFSPDFGTPQGVRSHSGLLGKCYLRSSYIHVGINDPVALRFDDSMQGFDIEFNSGVRWLSNERFGIDLYGQFEQQQMSGSAATGHVDIERNLSIVGTRIYALPHPRIRPYIGLSIGFDRVSIFAADNMGNVLSGKDHGSGFIANPGVEFDLVPRLSARADFEIVPEETDNGAFEGTLVWWAADRIFLRGGIIVPFDDELAAGGVIGAGISF